MRDLEESKTDELLTMLEELQDENEGLQDQISEAQQTISQLSSENSVLKRELQKKSEIIVTLNGQIEKLNESDLVLKQNEKLVQQNRELQLNAQKAGEEAEAMVSTVKHEYAVKKQELDSKIRQAARHERIVQNMETNYRDKLAEEAKRITEKAREAAEQEYREKAAKTESKCKEQRNAAYSITIGSLLYCFFATILTACNSPRFMKDMAAFASVMWELIAGPVLMAVEACKMVWNLNDMIPYPVINIIGASILVIIVFVLIAGLIYGLISYVIYETAKFYYKEFWDLISGIIALVSMGILVWFADALTWLTWNLVLVWLMIHGVYLLIRMMVSGSKNSRY